MEDEVEEKAKTILESPSGVIPQKLRLGFRGASRVLLDLLPQPKRLHCSNPLNRVRPSGRT